MATRDTSKDERGLFLESLVDTLGAVIWEFDWGTGAFTYVSAPAERLLGFPLEDWYVPGFWMERLHPDDSAWAAAYCMQATKDRRDHDFDYRMVRADGSAVWVRDIVTVDKQLGIEGKLRGMLLDVTAERESALEMEHRSHQFAAVFHMMRDLYFHLDSEGNVTHYEAASDGDLYLPPQAFLGRRLEDILPPDVAGVLAGGVARAHHDGCMAIAQYELPIHDEPHEWEARFLPIESGGTSVVVRDVTERNARQRQLAESRDFLSRLLSMLDAGVIVVDGSTRTIKSVNRPAEEMMGYEPDEMLGMSTAGLHASAEAFEAFNSGLADALMGEERRTATIQMRRKDGSLFDAEVTVRRISDESSDRLGIIRDVSDRVAAEQQLRDSERRFRSVVEGSPFGMHFYRLTGDELTFVGANPAADAILGFDHSLIEGLSIEDAFPGLHGTGVPDVYRGVALNGGVWQQEEIAYETDLVAGAFEVTAFQTSPGEMAVAFRDITERKVAQANEQKYLRRLSAMAADLTTTEDRERRRLAEELHDRVGQPLAVARMRLRGAQAASETPDLDELHLAEELVELAIQEVRVVTTELAPPVLYELGLGSALKWLCDELERKYAIEVHVSADADESEIDVETKMVLFRAARELVVNVVKHADTTEAWVNLSNEPGWFVLHVEDHGRGFDPDAVTGGTGDSGFGLFSIRERLPHLGGQFEMETACGEGTRVALRVPQGVDHMGLA